MSIELKQLPDKEVIENKNEKTNENGILPSEENPIVPNENENKSKKLEEDEDPDKELKKNLMFEQKNISVFKLYCHLSLKIEIVMMILGAIRSAGAGVAGPLMTLLFGDSLNDFGDTQDMDKMDQKSHNSWKFLVILLIQWLKNFYILEWQCFVQNFLIIVCGI